MKRLIADEGMVYTDGDVSGKEICLPDSADETKWYQVSEGEDLNATEADKDAALTTLGVDMTEG